MIELREQQAEGDLGADYLKFTYNGHVWLGDDGTWFYANPEREARMVMPDRIVLDMPGWNRMRYHRVRVGIGQYTSRHLPAYLVDMARQALQSNADALVAEKIGTKPELRIQPPGWED